jgi:phage-related protein
VFTITPTNAKTGGYGYRAWVTTYSAIDLAMPGYFVNLTGAGWDTAALVTAGKMQADGDDLVVQDNGAFIDRWLVGINTTTTKVFVNLSYQPRIEMTLSGAMAGSGAVSTITLKATSTNKTLLTRLPTPCLVMIDSEKFSVTAKDITKYQLTGTTRAQRSTSMAAHSDGATVRWLEHDLVVLYGNSAAEARAVDDTRKPMADLTNTTNTSLVQTEFKDAAGLRPMSWKPVLKYSVLKTSGSGYYTGSRGDVADPATEMGMVVKVAKIANIWKAETAIIEWVLYHPAGITHVTLDGEKYKKALNFPSAYLQKSNDGVNYSNVFTEAAPGSAATWTALSSHSAVSLSGTYKYLRLQFTGNLPATADNEADFSVQNVTLTIDSTKVPTVTMGSEENNYWLNATITNNTSGEAITLSGPLALNETLTVDCLNRTITLANGANALRWMTKSSRRVSWLDLAPGNNTLQFDDTGTAGVTVGISAQCRNN